MGVVAQCLSRSSGSDFWNIRKPKVPSHIPFAMMEIIPLSVHNVRISGDCKKSSSFL